MNESSKSVGLGLINKVRYMGKITLEDSSNSIVTVTILLGGTGSCSASDSAYLFTRFSITWFLCLSVCLSSVTFAHLA